MPADDNITRLAINNRSLASAPIDCVADMILLEPRERLIIAIVQMYNLPANYENENDEHC